MTTSIVSPITFIDRMVTHSELGKDFALMDHQREILRLAFAFNANGRLPWDTIIYSCIKKSGKTTLNAGLTLWWAFTQRTAKRNHPRGKRSGTSFGPHLQHHRKPRQI